MGGKNLASLEPLFFGRLGRVLVGLAVVYWAWEVWAPDFGSAVLGILLGLLGVSFLVGGLMGNPGCEITALPNLFFPPEKRYHTV